MDSEDVQIGERLQALRGPVISQAGLAHAMKERGHDKWSQATVWAVESGKRPLRLTEAVSIADFLHVNVGDLVQQTEAGLAMNAIRDATTEVSKIADDIRAKTLDFEDARTSLRDLVSSLDVQSVRRWSDSEQARLRSLLTEAQVQLKWSTEQIVSVDSRDDMDDEWLYNPEEEPSGLDR